MVAGAHRLLCFSRSLLDRFTGGDCLFLWRALVIFSACSARSLAFCLFFIFLESRASLFRNNKSPVRGWLVVNWAWTIVRQLHHRMI